MITPSGRKVIVGEEKEREKMSLYSRHLVLGQRTQAAWTKSRTMWVHSEQKSKCNEIYKLIY
jgi:hypothetical protein